jgi:hypothetical protein
VDDLVQWLRAQLDEDERIARDVQQPDDFPWEAWHMVGEAADGTVRWGVRGAGVQPTHEDPLNKARMEHIARHDPARVLRNIEAKRRILDEIVPQMNDMTDQIHAEFGVGPMDPSTYESLGLLRLLALPYADREGYQESWRP